MSFKHILTLTEFEEVLLCGECIVGLLQLNYASKKAIKKGTSLNHKKHVTIKSQYFATNRRSFIGH